jgi:hypothetical protein
LAAAWRDLEVIPFQILDSILPLGNAVLSLCPALEDILSPFIGDNIKGKIG